MNNTAAKVVKRRNKAGRPTEADLGQRKVRIMEVATELFLHNGYAATSLVDIAKGAGVATRTLYEHFGNKESIFRDVMFAQDTDMRLAPPVVSTGDTLYDVLVRIAHYSWEVAYSEKSMGLVRLMVAESKRFPELIRKLASLGSSRFRENVSGVFNDLQAAGLIPDMDHVESADFFIDLILGNSPMLIYSGWRYSNNADEMIQKKTELFILGRFGPEIAANARTNRAQIHHK